MGHANRVGGVGVFAFSFAVLAACGGGDGPAADADADVPEPEVGCVEDPLPLQPVDAHVLGETFYLPGFTGADDCAADLAWVIDEAPAGSENLIYATGAPQPRFTPDLPGTYRFSVPGEDAAVELTVVARTPAERFRNHYLTPLFGAAVVGDEVWTANGATYTVTRVGVDDLAVRGEVTVGSWPAAVAWRDPLPYVLVAQRGSDTLGFIDRDRGVLEDALWIGDEPTGIAIDPARDVAYVSLPTADEIAVVDLANRAVVDRVAVGFDPRALAVSPDGAHLVAATYRSRNAATDLLGTYDGAPDEDLFVVDLAERTVVGVATGVTAVQRALAFDADGRLYVAGTDSDPLPSQADPDALPFEHEVVRIDDLSDPNGPRAQVDLSRQPSSAGPVVGPSGVLVRPEGIWVASESSSVVVLLDAETFAEVARVDVGAGARQLVDLGDAGIAVHCYADAALWVVDDQADVVDVVALHDDARPPQVADGERVFLRPGSGVRANNACTSCHVEGQNEGMIWRFGPELYANVRPIQLLAATTPLGWSAYTSSADNFGYQGPGSILGRPPTVDEADAAAAFFASLIGAPRANAHTRLDGSYTDAGLRGKALFEGKALCSSCHRPPLYTLRTMVEEGKSGEPADIPSLLGVYRHGIYFIHGQARRLDAAIDVAIAFVDVQLSADERADLLAFVRQLTPKGSAPLGMYPDLGSEVAVEPDVAPWVEFADPPRGDASAFVTLETAGGEPVAGTLVVTGGFLQLTPDEPLAPGSYAFTARAGLPFATGGALVADRTVRFDVADAGATWPDAPLTMTVTVAPGPGGGLQQRFDLERTADGVAGETRVQMRAAAPVVHRQQLWVQIDGDEVVLEPFALPIGSAFGDAREVRGTITATNPDGSIARVEGTLTISAPGNHTTDIAFVIE